MDSEEQQKAEEEFRKLREVLPQYMCVYSADESPLYANDGLLDYLGFTLEDFRADTFQARAFHPDDLKRVQSVREQAMSRGEGWEIETRIRRKDGEYRWFLIRGKPLRDGAGTIVRWFSSGTDIEDRKQAEVRLQRAAETRALFEEIVSSTMDGILAFDGDGRYTVWNPALEQIFGVKEVERIGKMASDLCPFFRQSGGKNCYSEALAGRGIVATDVPYTFEDTGRQIFLDGHFSPLLDSEGRVAGGLAIIRDVTERRKAEKELQETIDAVPQHMIVLAADGEALYVNKVALDFYGFTLEECLDQNSIKQKIHPDDLASYLDTRQRGISSGAPFAAEVRLRSRLGHYRWFLVLFNPQRNDQGQAIRWYATATDIEDRKQAERELHQLVDAVPNHIVVHSAEGRRIYANQVTLDFLGRTLQEFLDDREAPPFHPDDLTSFFETRQRGISAGKAFEMEVRLRKKDGCYRWFLFRFNPHRNEHGEISGWYSTGTDIEDQKQAERELQQLVDFVPHFMTVHSGDGRRLYLNKRGLDFFGWRPQDFSDENATTRAFHPEDLSDFVEKRQRGISAGAPFELEVRALRKDGQYRWYLFLYNPYRNEQGQIVRWYATGTDIEDRKQAERELQQLVDTIPHQVVVLDAEGRRVYANKVVLDFLGWTLEEFMGGEAIRAFHPDDWVDFQLARRAFSQGLPFQTEARLRRRDGQYRWFLFLYNPYRDERGQIVRWYGTGTDIEDRKQAEEALRRTQAYLTEAQALGHTGSWAHDAIRREIIYWSPESYRIFGFDPQVGPITYRQAHSLIHPDDLARFDETLETAIREKSGAKIDFRLRFPDGTIKYVHCVSHPVLNVEGEVVELVGTNMDVTEQWEARAALEEAFAEINQLKDELYRENLALKEEIDQTSMFEEIVGTSEVLKRVLAQVARVGPTDSTVLITGETGTGKELIARAIHKRSKRAAKPFVAVNCAALPPALIGSELFGHEKGAFTGAMQRRLGRFELADGGTLFLDEVGDVPEETQIALLRVLEERQFERIGGGQPISVDVRIIAATNRELRGAVAAGRFRSDLFYRLNVFPLAVPPLRDRKDDIPLLVEYLVERYASKAGKEIKNIQKRTLNLFKAYDWPGNIRELQNVIERAVILCDGDTFTVDGVWLQPEMPSTNQYGSGLARPTDEQERRLIESALSDSRGRIAGPSGAAAKLGIPRSTLETKIKKLGIRKHQFSD